MMAKCPFVDPEFVMEKHEPCPVCGMTGDVDAEDKCVGNIVSVGDELHQVLADALASKLCSPPEAKGETDG